MLNTTTTNSRKQMPGENLDLLKNLDFWTRTLNAKTILFSSDYFNEGHFEVATEMAALMEQIYRKSVAVVDLRNIEEQLSYPGLQYQNVNECEWLKSNGNINERKLSAHIKTLSEQYSIVFIIHDVKRICESTDLPELDFDGAILVRGPKSVGPGKKRYVTNKIKDASLPILGLIYSRW